MEASCGGTCPHMAASLSMPARTFQISRQKQDCRGVLPAGSTIIMPPLYTPLQIQKPVQEPSLHPVYPTGAMPCEITPKDRERVTVTASNCEQCTLWESVSPDKRNDDDSYQLEKECQVSLVFAVLLTPHGPSPIGLHNLNLTACMCFLASLRKHRNSSFVLPFSHIGILK